MGCVTRSPGPSCRGSRAAAGGGHWTKATRAGKRRCARLEQTGRSSRQDPSQAAQERGRNAFPLTRCGGGLEGSDYLSGLVWLLSPRLGSRMLFPYLAMSGLQALPPILRMRMRPKNGVRHEPFFWWTKNAPRLPFFRRPCLGVLSICVPTHFGTRGIGAFASMDLTIRRNAAFLFFLPSRLFIDSSQFPCSSEQTPFPVNCHESRSCVCGVARHTCAETSGFSQVGRLEETCLDPRDRAGSVLADCRTPTGRAVARFGKIRLRCTVAHAPE